MNEIKKIKLKNEDFDIYYCKHNGKKTIAISVSKDLAQILLDGYINKEIKKQLKI